MEEFDVRVVVGSPNDAEKANFALEVLHVIGVTYEVSVASCHRNIGGELEEFVTTYAKEGLFFCIGGMEFALPGILEAMERNAHKYNHIILAAPLDTAARSAIENLPAGTAILTAGLNEVSLKHSLINSALAVAKLVAFGVRKEVAAGLQSWHLKNAKPLIKKVWLDDKGLIPISEKK